MATDDRRNLGAAFEQIVREQPAGTALRFPDALDVSFAELDAVANGLANRLLDEGIRRHDVVAIIADKTTEVYASMVASLKIGAIYTHLDLNSPWSRIDKIVDRCRPSLVLYDSVRAEVLDRLTERGIATLDLRSASNDATGEQRASPVTAANVTGADPAYIMFTSGSTGFPKGAVMSHANVLNFSAWARSTFSIGPGDTLTNVNPLYFDNSVFDVYAGLFSGAAVCPISTEQVEQPRDIVRMTERAGCTIWFSVPSMLVYLLTMRAIQSDDLPTLRTVVFGGEGFPKPKLAQLWDLLGDRVKFVNVYGPTECTCICSAHPIGSDDIADQSELAPLGHLAPDFDHYIEPIDDSDPSTGVLYLGGPNVGLGYYNDSDRTAEAFVQPPHIHEFRSVFYRTGDLVRRTPDGMLHFTGRVDNQIKHMGYRIELEEVDAGLNALSYVEEAAAVYHRDGDGPGTIVGFVAIDGSREQSGILADLATVLPHYMLPKKLHVLDALPKNRNGKIDRPALSELVS